MVKSRLAAGALAALVGVGVAASAAVGVAFADSTSPSTSPSSSTSATTDGKVIFRVGTLQDVDSMNPYKGITASAYEMWALMYDTLTGYSAADFAPTPRLAESWEQSADGLTWTYHLRQGVNFSDGVPLTSKDVVYSFERVMNGKVEKTNWGSYVAQIKSVKATDDYTVVMTLKKPTPIMERLAVPILPEHIWSKISEDDVRKYPNEPQSTPPGGIGSGPFILTQAREGQSWSFTRNDSYWDGPAHIDGIDFILYRNADAMVQALKNGEIDFADDLDATIFKSLENVDNVVARSSVYYGFNYLTMNGGATLTDGTPIGNGHPSLKDPQVRLAIHYAVDLPALVNRTLDGRGTPGTSIIPPLYPEHYEPPDPITYDPAKANQILDDAGYKKGPDGIRTMPDGTDPLVYQLYARENSEASKTTIQFLQGWLKDIGIGSKVDIVSESRLYEIAGQGNFDMYEWGWVVEPDPDYQLSTFTCAQLSYKWSDGVIYGGLNDSFYCNKKYDKLYAQQSTDTNRESRTATAQQMQKMVYDANAYIVTEYYDYLQAYRSDHFTGFVPQPSPDGAILFQYGTYSYMNIRPVDASTASGGSSTSTGLVVAGVAAAAVLVGVIVWLVARSRRSGDADVE
ncbi:MAG: ABC transporter substrate-binding protein [Actinomycetes bacterium]